MRNVLLVLALVGIGGATALADYAGPPPTPGYDYYKTPPLATSDHFWVPISYHSTATYTNWAGVIIDINIDPNPVEAHWTGYGAAPDIVATSGGLPGVPGVTFWSPNAFNSGEPNPASVWRNLGALEFHATNTDPVNNSDVDINFSAWNIWHVPTSQQSQIVTVPASIWLYVRPGMPWGQPVPPGQGYWVHNEQTYVTHLVASLFFATQTYIAGGAVGVEHVPEPASAALVLGGLGALVVARRRRHRA